MGSREQGGPVVARVVVVSNRVGIPNRDGGARAGGLEVVLRSFLKRNQGVWFGWSGKNVPKGEEVVREVEHSGVTYITTDISRGDFQEFYNGFANRMLWPILHYRLDLVEFSSRDMAGYLRVNEMFADRLQAFLRPDDVIWVHDYHFLPLAKALRERGVENKIGFFLHIPFPPPDLLTALPKHERTILSLCHYDLVGFQTDNDADNLADYLTNECADAEPRPPHLHRRPAHDADRRVPGRRRDGGVRAAGPARRASSPPVREVVRSLADRSMIIGVDRLDYSKGIGMRMRAFEQFLTSYPRWRGAVTYLQITPRSRSDIREYADMERRIDETVGRVNGHYGEAAWTPIRYVNRSHSRTDTRRPVPLVPRRAGDAAARRHESRRQGICRGAGPGGSGRADPVALCRRRGRMPGGAAGQSLRSGGGGRRHRPGAVDAA